MIAFEPVQESIDVKPTLTNQSVSTRRQVKKQAPVPAEINQITQLSTELSAISQLEKRGPSQYDIYTDVEAEVP